MNTTKRNYEALYIIDAESTDEQIAASIAKYSDIIASEDGEVIAAGKWDKRRLAYEIKGKREGLYILIYFAGENNVYNELDRIFKIADDVIRHIIVRVEPEHIDTKRLAAADEKPEAAEAPAEEPVQAAEEAAPAEEAPATEEAPAEEAPNPEEEAPAEE